jgi:hypothetical protein
MPRYCAVSWRRQLFASSAASTRLRSAISPLAAIDKHFRRALGRHRLIAARNRKQPVQPRRITRADLPHRHADPFDQVAQLAHVAGEVRVGDGVREPLRNIR